MSKSLWDIAPSGGNFEPAPVGVHKAIAIQLLDLGTQTGEYNGEPTVRRQCHITWELPEELREDGQPFTISKFYTLSKNDKTGSLYISEKSNLYKDLTSWFGKAPEAFDPESLLGKGCQVIVTEKNDKHVVNAVAGLKKNDKVDAPVNPTRLFLLDDFNEDLFDELPQGLKKMIMKSPEYAAIVNGGVSDDDADETIPF